MRIQQHCIRFKWIFSGIAIRNNVVLESLYFLGSWTKRCCCRWVAWLAYISEIFLIRFLYGSSLCLSHCVITHKVFSWHFFSSSLPQKCDQFVRFLYSIFVVGRRILGRGQTGGFKEGQRPSNFLNHWKQVSLLQTHNQGSNQLFSTVSWDCCA